MKRGATILISLLCLSPCVAIDDGSEEAVTLPADPFEGLCASGCDATPSDPPRKLRLAPQVCPDGICRRNIVLDFYEKLVQVEFN